MKNPIEMSKTSNLETDTLLKRRRRRKHLSPYKKGKYAISKLDEYEVYLNQIDLLGAEALEG